MSAYLTTEEVAERFRTSPETVRWWRYVGRGPKSFAVGRRRLYAIEDVKAWEAEARAGAVAP
ncbi:MAG TPA: helix-turn-helix domain-containing protein [Coriobacteriia bacterium]|nr:helix-turn-helix domain-containing protein [Coriobacteriia bacterium]